MQLLSDFTPPLIMILLCAASAKSSEAYIMLLIYAAAITKSIQIGELFGISAKLYFRPFEQLLLDYFFKVKNKYIYKSLIIACQEARKYIQHL